MRFAQIQHPDVNFVYVNLRESDYLLKYTDKRVFKRDLNEHEQWIANGLVKKDVLKRVKVEGKIAYIRNFKLDESQIQVSLYKDMLNEDTMPGRLAGVAAIKEATQKYYHGSYDKLDVGTVLTPGGDDYESSWGGTSFYGPLEKFRPPEKLAHKEGVFMVGNDDDVDVAGGATDYVYVVEPVGEVQKHDLNWGSEISMLIDDGHTLNDPEVKEAAENYWNGVPHHNEQVWEYLAPRAKIVSVLNEDWKKKATGAVAGAALAAAGVTALKQNTSQPDLQMKTQVAQTIEQDPYDKEFGDVNTLKNMIKQHEGKRLKVYKDTVGKNTIGYGHLVKPGEDFSKGITDQQADEMFNKDFANAVQVARTTPGYNLADQKRKQAMVDLAYNMGPNWHKSWPKFSAAAANGDWKTAAKELQNSKWYKQVGHRGNTIVNMIAGR